MYPAVGTVHAALDALREIMERESFLPSEVSEIDVGLAAFAIAHGGSIVHPTDTVSAQFSLAFSLGLRLLRNENSLDSYTNPALWSDPGLLAFAERVTTHPIEIPRDECQLGATVDVVLRDGRRFSAKQRAPTGHPDNPAQPGDVEAKFYELTSGLVPDGVAARIVRMVDRLEDEPDLTKLLELLTARVPAAGRR